MFSTERFGTDTCSDGSCGHSGDPCTSGPECNNDCNEGADNCAVTAGTPCDDGRVCTANDACDGEGTCIGAGEPSPDCRTAAKSILLWKDTVNDTKDKLIWKWIKGEQTSQEEFGAAAELAQSTLCIYAGTPGAVVGEVVVPSDPVKWQPIGTKGYKYKDNGGAADGVQKIVLKGSTENKSKALVKGKGTNLPTPGLPWDLPVTAQLVNSETGICWEGVYNTDDVKKNREDQFKAKAQTR